ncbi:MAG: hypothetical protein M1423_00140, partial [Acidobacteria bacterium]|nr:hypothetical protein [Acidobacteriota bacterium]
FIKLRTIDFINESSDDKNHPPGYPLAGLHWVCRPPLLLQKSLGTTEKTGQELSPSRCSKQAAQLQA